MSVFFGWEVLGELVAVGFHFFCDDGADVFDDLWVKAFPFVLGGVVGASLDFVECCLGDVESDMVAHGGEVVPWIEHEVFVSDSE